MKFFSSPVLLRTASVVSLLYCLGHMSGYPWTPGQGAEAEAVVQGMQSVRFDAMDANRAYWDFYVGFGHITGAALFVQALCLWLLASVARRDGSLAVPLTAAFMLGSAVNAGLSFRYFFTLPGAFAVTIALLLLGSILSTRRVAA